MSCVINEHQHGRESKHLSGFLGFEIQIVSVAFWRRLCAKAVGSASNGLVSWRVLADDVSFDEALLRESEQQTGDSSCSLSFSGRSLLLLFIDEERAAWQAA